MKDCSMTIRLMTVFALAALCGTAPVVAADEESGTSQSSGNGSEVVCQVQRITGSRLNAKRVCLTRDQWREQRQQQRQDLQRAQGARTGPDIVDPPKG
jgi:hypothetical protein